MQQFFLMNQWLLIIALIWSMIWKGLALWKSARRKEEWWFIVLLVVNTLGILDILYLYVFSREKKEKAQQQV
jgi:methionyl-tRNA synthetase